LQGGRGEEPGGILDGTHTGTSSIVPSIIDITNQFPPTRERTVLLELLRVVRNLQKRD